MSKGKMANATRRNVIKVDHLLHSAIDVDQVILAEIEALRQHLPHRSGLEAGLGRVEKNAIRNSELVRSAKEELGTRMPALRVSREPRRRRVPVAGGASIGCLCQNT
jgi:hypothetical protein